MTSTAICGSVLAELFDAVGDDLEGVDVEAGVGLVEDGELRLEHRHLEDLVALLLAAGEAFVDRALEERLVEFDHLDLLSHEREEVHGVELLLAAMVADGVERGPEEVGVADARDLDRVLEGEEEALAGAGLGVELEQVLVCVADLAAGDLVLLASGEDAGQGALAGAVGSHDGVDLAGFAFEVDALEDLCAFDGYV